MTWSLGALVEWRVTRFEKGGDLEAGKRDFGEMPDSTALFALLLGTGAIFGSAQPLHDDHPANKSFEEEPRCHHRRSVPLARPPLM
jgi:hypothetical protein